MCGVAYKKEKKRCDGGGGALLGWPEPGGSGGAEEDPRQYIGSFLFLLPRRLGGVFPFLLLLPAKRIAQLTKSFNYNEVRYTNEYYTNRPQDELKTTINFRFKEKVVIEYPVKHRLGVADHFSNTGNNRCN